MTDAELQSRLEALEKGLHGLLQRFNELQRSLMYRYGMRTTEDPAPEPHHLPRKYTGPTAGLIDVPVIDPPTQATQRAISEQKP